MSNVLLIVDPQNDFMDQDGSMLPVPGATDDMLRLSEYIQRFGSSIDRIIVTKDSHPADHIGQAHMWVDSSGSHPEPFTQITKQDWDTGRWKPSDGRNKVFYGLYINRLERWRQEPNSLSQIPLTIYPDHCIVGSNGEAIFEPLHKTLVEWSRKYSRDVIYHTKEALSGMEYLSAIKPETIPLNSVRELPFPIKSNDTVIVAGEALGHCVAETVLDIGAWLTQRSAYNFFEKMTLLANCTSPIQGDELRSREIVITFKKLGMHIKNAPWLDENHATSRKWNGMNDIDMKKMIDHHRAIQRHIQSRVSAMRKNAHALMSEN